MVRAEGPGDSYPGATSAWGCDSREDKRREQEDGEGELVGRGTKKSQVGTNKERSRGSSRSKLCTVLQSVMLDLAAHSKDNKPGEETWWKVGLAENKEP